MNVIRDNLAKWLVGVSRKVTGKKYELSVIVDENKLGIDFLNPNNLKEHSWNSDHYVNGNIFYSGYSNPIKISKDNEDIELISSDKYSTYMENKLIEDIVHAHKKDKSMDILRYAVYGVLALQVFVTLFLVFGNQLGV